MERIGLNVQRNEEVVPETIDLIEDIAGSYEVVERNGVVATVQVGGPRKVREQVTFVQAPTVRRQKHVNGVLVEERPPEPPKPPAKGQNQSKPTSGGKR